MLGKQCSCCADPTSFETSVSGVKSVIGEPGDACLLAALRSISPTMPPHRLLPPNLLHRQRRTY